MRSQRRAEYVSGNAILDRLPSAELDALRPHLDVYTEDESAVVQRCGRRLDGVLFPIDAIYSVIVEFANGDAYEVGLIGRDAMVGAEIVVGMTVGVRSVICQAEGRTVFLSAERLRGALAGSDALLAAAQQALRRQWFVSQQSVACNFAHTLDQRIARWVLMTYDAIGRSHFPLRLEFLHVMAGAKEPEMRNALGRLAAIGTLTYADERLTLHSPDELRENACECYERQLADPLSGSENLT